MLDRREIMKRAGLAALATGFGSARAFALDTVTLPLDNGERPLVAFPQKRPLILLTPRPPQLDPGREAALWIDIESRDPRAASCPGDRKLGGERRFAGAALALCDRDDQPRHSPSALAEPGGGW